jgi:hypothetical protein
MITLRNIGTLGIGVLLSTQPVHGQAASTYREYTLGTNLAAVAGRAGVAVSEAQVVHQRPAMMIDLKWRAPYAFRSAEAVPVDPVQEIVFSFYDDQLFRIVVDYTRERTEGMTDADLIEAISATYGPVSRRAQKTLTPSSRLAQETGAAIGAWGDGDYSAILYRTLYGAGIRLIVTDARLDALARTATARATRLDDLDAPARDAARQKKEADEQQLAREKARAANKAAFKP